MFRFNSPSFVHSDWMFHEHITTQMGRLQKHHEPICQSIIEAGMPQFSSQSFTIRSLQ